MKDVKSFGIDILPFLAAFSSYSVPENRNLFLGFLGNLGSGIEVGWQDVVTRVREEDPQHLQGSLVLGPGIQHQKAVAVLEVVGENGAIHLPQRWIANQGRAHAAITSNDFTCEGNWASTSHQGNRHLAKGSV